MLTTSILYLTKLFWILLISPFLTAAVAVTYSVKAMKGHGYDFGQEKSDKWLISAHGGQRPLWWFHNIYKKMKKMNAR